MKQHFRGWHAVATELEALAAARGTESWPLNSGQSASLRGIKTRLPDNGVIIADEVGMGKTRIAVALARCVLKAGGRVAVLVPPGLGYQWRDELRDGGIQTPHLLRSLWQYLAAWDPQRSGETPWFEQDVVLVSHAFTNWRLGENSDARRWALLPTLYAWWRKQQEKRFPRGFNGHEKLTDGWVQVAAKSIAETVAGLPESHQAVRLITELSDNTPWPGAMDGAAYSRNQSLRPWLERAVGLGLGLFDLVIIDEAHKSRGDESGLSRMLDQVVLVGDTARRLAMTATPVELDVLQWHQTLGRIGIDSSTLCNTDGDIFERYADACAKVRQCPGNGEAREIYRSASGAFQSALSPYLLRRDKREASWVQAFAKRANTSIHAYRKELEVSVDTLTLNPGWRQAVCAAEALSIVSSRAEDSISKRIRLTMGNGHGISALLDHVKRDAEKDHQQVALDSQQAAQGCEIALFGDVAQTPPANKRSQRSAWWRQVISGAFSGNINPLYEHPALLAAADAIEAVTRKNEKVLVFGRFTLPLQALVALLNAREMLRTLDSGNPWPQAKIHENEWQAIQAAHRQLERAEPLDREQINSILIRQYRELENRRSESRAGLIEQLDAGLPAEGTQRQVFGAFKRMVELHGESSDSPLALVAKVMQELTGSGQDQTNASRIAAAFTDLIEAASERGEGDVNGDGSLDDDEANNLWSLLKGRLEEEFNRPQGGVARLMNGDTKPETRRLLQLAFNRPHSNPRVLVAQSVVGREGLNLHKACKTVVLLHPEWNPGVVEQQIGRVDRVGSLWEQQLETSLNENISADDLPRILIRPIVFKGTYDEQNWAVLRERWDELRAQLHGVVISPRMSEDFGIDPVIASDINACAPNFSPEGFGHKNGI